MRMWKPLSRVASGAKALGVVGTGIGAAASYVERNQKYLDAGKSPDEANRAAITGAASSTVASLIVGGIGMVVGTAIGGPVGGIIGASLGAVAGGMLADWVVSEFMDRRQNGVG